MKCRTFTVALFFVILMTMLNACGDSATANDSTLIGRWQYEDVVLEFSSDYTGHERFMGQEFNFTWKTNGNSLEIDFNEESEDSFIYEVLSHDFHGVPVESLSFYFLDDGEVLMLHDDHGDHWHFILEFVKIN